MKEYEIIAKFLTIVPVLHIPKPSLRKPSLPVPTTLPAPSTAGISTNS